MITPSFGLTATERVLPKLALDFTTASLDSRVTFTRTTGASNPATYVNSSGVITAATNDQPRFDYDPVTLACKGLLIEEARTNILVQSQDFSTIWTNTGSTESVDVVVSPDGTQNADKLVEDNTNGNHYIEQLKTTTAASHTLSVYAKAGERVWVRVFLGSVGNAYFNLSTGVVGTIAGAITTSITNAGNGWYRCSVTGVTTAALNAHRFYPAPADNTSSYQGDNTSGIYIWGAQLEAGAFATSYIPTTLLPLTRNADVATMTGTNFSDWFNASEGTFVAQFNSRVSAAGPTGVMSANNTSSTYAIDMRVQSSALYGRVANSGNVFFASAGAVTDGQSVASCIGYKTDDFAVSRNGATPTTDTAGTVPTQPNRLLIGGLDAGAFPLNSHLQKLSYYPQRLTNAEVQAFSKE